MDLNEGQDVVHLKPGEAHLTDRGELVVTVLGSCLSVTMFSSRKRLAGICHSLLPECGKPERCGGECGEGYKYVACSIRQMAAAFERFAVPREEIEVKCFGGADMFARRDSRPELLSIGRQNILMAGRVIAAEGLRLKAQDVGGLLGRKVFFYTHSGEVLLKRLRGAGNSHPLAPEGRKGGR
ncbi:MAG TPA: chemotaxis protein CheD [Desulfuromonadaceae bacterium]